MVWIVIRTEQAVPQREQGTEIGSLMGRILTVVDMMVSRRHEDPFQPVRLPAYVHMHPIVPHDMLNHDDLERPGSSTMQQRKCCYVGEVEQEDVRNRRADPRQPIEIRWRMVPSMNRPCPSAMHEPVSPVQTEVLNDIKQDELADRG